MNATELERLELVIDTAGVSRRIELLLPIGVRPRQLSVRTLLLGILLVAAACRPAHLRRVHQALTALPEAQQRRLGIIAHWRDGPHLLTYRQVERTFGLVVSKLADDTPDGTPSELLSQVLDQLLEASITVLGEPATSSYAVDWTDQETWSRPPPKRDTKRDDPKPNPDNDGDHEPTADPKQPTPDNDGDHEPTADPKQPTPDNDGDGDGDGDGEDDQRCADPEAAWGHRRGNHPGQKDEAFYGYYLQAATTVKDEHGPEVPELARRMLLTSCHVDPPPAFVPVLERMASDNITIADVLADSGYAYRVAENWALPIRALGAELIQDLHPNDRGPNGTHMGATCANGNLYCPATPTTLLQTQPLARGASAEQTAKHDQQCAELARYKLSPITRPDPDGYHRATCPAAQGKLRCPLRPDSMTRPHDRPTILAPPQHPPACCQQKTITVPAQVNAKTAQKHDYPSKAHRDSYNRRSAAERTYATIKDPATNNLNKGWCRIMGLAGIALLTATVLIARNLRINDAHATRQAENERRATNGLPPKRRKRRRQSANDLISATHPPP